MRKMDAYVVYLIQSGAYALFSAMVYTIVAVYYMTVVGLNPLQLVLVGTVLEISTLLFEVPTGVVADVYSRRVSTIIGIFLLGVAFMLEGSIPLFAAILLVQTIRGIGHTFISGALDAWVADEVGAANMGRAYLRSAQVGQISSVIGTFVSVSLASIRVNLPIVVGGGLFIGLGVFLLLAMPERGFIPTMQGDRASWKTMAATLRAGVQTIRRRPALITILSISGFYGMFSEGHDRLWEAHFLKHFTFPNLGQFKPIIWFGIINVGSGGLSVIANEIARRRLDMDSHLVMARALRVIYTLLIAGVILFGLAGNFVLALAAYWSARLFRSTAGPIYTTWLNQHIGSKVRATVLSMSSQTNALGQIVGGPILGTIGTARSIRAAIVGAGVCLSPTILLVGGMIRRDGDTQKEINDVR